MSLNARVEASRLKIYIYIGIISTGMRSLGFEDSTVAGLES